MRGLGVGTRGSAVQGALTRAQGAPGAPAVSGPTFPGGLRGAAEARLRSAALHSQDTAIFKRETKRKQNGC